MNGIRDAARRAVEQFVDENELAYTLELPTWLEGVADQFSGAGADVSDLRLLADELRAAYEERRHRWRREAP